MTLGPSHHPPPQPHTHTCTRPCSYVILQNYVPSLRQTAAGWWQILFFVDGIGCLSSASLRSSPFLLHSYSNQLRMRRGSALRYSGAGRAPKWDPRPLPNLPGVLLIVPLNLFDRSFKLNLDPGRKFIKLQSFSKVLLEY